MGLFPLLGKAQTLRPAFKAPRDQSALLASSTPLILPVVHAVGLGKDI